MSASGGRVAGKVALVTGAARNQGLSHSRLLAEQGAHVIMADLDEGGEAAAMALSREGLAVRYLRLDVSQEQDWQAAMQSIAEREGRLDVLVNNAAILGKANFTDCSLEEWNLVLAVNQTGTFLGVQHGAAQMMRTGGGSIINISSVIGNLGTTFNAAYSVSKAAVQMITRIAAVTYAPQVRVNTIIPGGIDTDMLRALPEDVRKQRLAAYPMGRAGRIEEVSSIVLFLASDEATFTTGGEIRADGGALAGVRR